MNKLHMAFVFLAICSICCSAQNAPADDMEKEFEKRYVVWQTWMANNPTSPNPTGSDAFKSIIALGPHVVPVLIRKMSKDKDGFHLTDAIQALTKTIISPDRWPEGRFCDAFSAVQVFQTWWDVDRKKIHETYKDLARQWNDLKASEKIPRSDTGLPLLWYDLTVYDQRSGTLMPLRRRQITEIGQVYLDIQYLGIDALPLIAEDLAHKKYDFLPIFIELTKCPIDEKERRAEQRATAVLAWWTAEKEKWIIPER